MHHLLSQELQKLWTTATARTKNKVRHIIQHLKTLKCTQHFSRCSTFPDKQCGISDLHAVIKIYMLHFLLQIVDASCRFKIKLNFILKHNKSIQSITEDGKTPMHYGYPLHSRR